MVELTIFGDESGTMPADDGDGPFCAAAVSVVGELPRLGALSGHRSDIIDACKKITNIQQIVYVLPRPDYGQLLASKTSKMNTMARASRLTTGSHDYLPQQGYNPRNLIWIRCMAVCLLRAVVRTSNLQAIESVRVVLDRKTITGRERSLFADRVRSQSLDIFGQDSRRYDVEVLWSDDPEASAFQDGLFLAHHLSRLARKSVERGSEEVLAQELDVPRPDLFYDITSDIVAPLPRWSIEKWKARTGLPEPSE